MTHPHDPPPDGAARAADRDPLRPELNQTEAALEHQIAEVNSLADVRSETTAELIRLEATLSEAAGTAKRAVSPRRRRRSVPARAPRPLDAGAPGGGESTLGTRDGGGAPTGEAKPGTESGAEPAGIREFGDAAGRRWRAWIVRPSRPRSATYEPDYEAGWVTFEALDGSELRRLPQPPDDWAAADDGDLAALLERAVPGRARRGTG
ncbi:MAG TPA: hypothetical protein VNA89_08010 [Gemmatimonadaceae bacterium]|nr:hypothetical protein [Gemmatimonadaceae bacterium]